MKSYKNMKINNHNDNVTNADDVPYSREPELEAIIGEINVADFQSRRLNSALSDKVAGYMHLGGGYYRKNKNDNNTATIFCHSGRLYRISISVRGMTR